MRLTINGERAMRDFGAELSSQLHAGDIVLLEGDLGAGKTTLVRGLLEGLGHVGPVRSPTFNLIQLFATEPPVMHADLYRVGSTEGLGLEDYLESHLCLIEWPDRAKGLLDPEDCWQINIDFADPGRVVEVVRPK